MTFNVSVDWKLAVAVGGSAVGLVFAVKLDPTAIKEVAFHAIDTYKEYALAKSKC